MKILVLDNYDSFTYNLVEYIRTIGDYELDVYRNQEIEIEKVAEYDKILLSPGPGIPDEAGILKELIATYACRKSILGICLGHQAIAEVFGGKLENMDKVYHGIASHLLKISDQSVVLKNCKEVFLAGRYHSWQVKKENLPDCLEVTCCDDEKNIMGLRHKEFDVEGVQFHPESILTPDGKEMIRSWLKGDC